MIRQERFSRQLHRLVYIQFHQSLIVTVTSFRSSVSLCEQFTIQGYSAKESARATKRVAFEIDLQHVTSARLFVAYTTIKFHLPFHELQSRAQHDSSTAAVVRFLVRKHQTSRQTLDALRPRIIQTQPTRTILHISRSWGTHKHRQTDRETAQLHQQQFVATTAQCIHACNDELTGNRSSSNSRIIPWTLDVINCIIVCAVQSTSELMT